MQERAVETQVCSLCHNPVPDATAVAEPQLAVSTIGAADAKVAVLRLFHESNTFSTEQATLAAFTVRRGPELLSRTGRHSVVQGFADAAAAEGLRLVPLLGASSRRASPAVDARDLLPTHRVGAIAAETYDKLLSEVRAMLRAGAPWAGVLIANHGAAVAEQHADCDGAFCAAVREVVGEKTVVGVCLDMHANVSQLLVTSTDVCCVWRTTPHVDMHERGYKTAELVARAIRREIHPVQWVARPPLVVNVTKHFTDVEPMLSVVRDCAAATGERVAILDTSVALGSPYVDTPHMGMSFIAIADHADLTAAKEAARWMATRAWDHRAALCLPGPARAYGTAVVGNKATATAAAAVPELTCDGAMRAADRQFVGRKPPRQREGNSAAADGDGGRAPLGPIVIMDVGDNISGGAPGDSTHLLRAALRQRVEGFLQTLVDPAAVAACLAAGVGGSVRGLAVGGKVDSLHGEPVEVAGVVTAISEGEWEDPGPVHGGPRRFSAGACASVLVARGKVTLVLTSKRCPNVSLGVFTHLGIAPEAFRVIVAKGVESPRLAFEPIAAALLTANTPGITSVDMTTFAFQHRRVPFYPFEKNAQLPWQEQGAAEIDDWRTQKQASSGT